MPSTFKRKLIGLLLMGAIINIKTDDSEILLDTRNQVEKRMKPIQQFDKNNILINEFPSIAEAERMTGIKNIRGCINNHPHRKSAGGYYWRLAQGEENEY